MPTSELGSLVVACLLYHTAVLSLPDLSLPLHVLRPFPRAQPAVPHCVSVA